MGGLLEKKKLFPYLYRTLAKKKNSSRNYQLKQNSDFSFYVSNKDSGGKYIPFLQKTQYGFKEIFGLLYFLHISYSICLKKYVQNPDRF